MNFYWQKIKEYKEYKSREAHRKKEAKQLITEWGSNPTK